MVPTNFFLVFNLYMPDCIIILNSKLHTQFHSNRTIFTGRYINHNFQSSGKLISGIVINSQRK